MTEAFAYDVFLSYCHAADRGLAKAIQVGLQQLGKPWNRPHAIRVFRDETDLSASPDAWERINVALRNSRWLILIASQEAARSPWVAREIEAWVALGRRGRLLIALANGELVWDGVAGDWDWGKTDVLPTVLSGVTAAEPAWVDFRRLRDQPAFDRGNQNLYAGVARLSAQIRSVGLAELVGDDFRQYRRTMRYARLLVTGLTSLLIVAILLAIIAMHQRDLANASLAEALLEKSVAALRENRELDARAFLAAARGLSTKKRVLATMLSMPRPRARAVGTAFLREGMSPDDLGGRGFIAGFLPDSSVFATAVGPIVTLWDARTLRTVETKDLRSMIRDPNLYVHDIAFSPNGRWMAVAHDGEVTLWPLVGRTVDATSVVVSAPTRIAYVGNEDHLVVAAVGSTRTFDSSSGQWTNELARGGVPADLLATIPGTIVISDLFEDALVHDVSAGRTLALKQSVGVRHMVVVPESEGGPRRVAGVLPQGQDIVLWDLDSGARLQQPLTHHEDRIRSVSVTPDGRYVISGGIDRTVRLWDLSEGHEVARLGRPGPVVTTAVSSDSRYLVTASYPDVLTVWQILADRELGLLSGCPRDVRAIAISADGNRIASGTEGGAVCVWDRQTSALLGEVHHPSSLKDLAFNPTGTLLVTVGGTGGVCLWSIPELIQLSQVETEADSIAFSPNGDHAAVVHGRALTVFRVGFDMLADHQRHTIPVGPEWPLESHATKVAYLADGKHVLTSDNYGRVYVFNVATDDEPKMFVGSPGDQAIQAMAIGIGGTTLATGGEDTVIRLWSLGSDWSEAAQPVETAQLLGHGAEVVSLEFVRAGEWLISSSLDGSVRIWDVAHREELASLSTSRAVAAAPTGSVLVTSMGDGSLRIWSDDFPTRAAVERETLQRVEGVHLHATQGD